MTSVIQLRGPVLVGPDDERPQAWVLGGRLTFERPTAAGLDVQVVDGWTIPGLVDAHSHVGLGPTGAVDDETTLAQARTDRDAGTLLIRDAGSPRDTRWLDDVDDVPQLVRAGRHLARTGRYLRNYAIELEPEELPDAVREQARRGDGWVKLVGDWIDRELGDLGPSWPLDALTAAIAAAHEEGARVTAHCFGEDCLPDLLDAGIDCLEHATGLTDATRATCVERGVAIVPTLINTENFPAFAAAGEAKFPTYAAHMRTLYTRRHATVADAYEAGIRVYAGTDAGGSLAHGLLPSEVASLVEAGLPPVDALDAACWSARAWLGRPGIEEGAPADVVVYADDPRADVGVLTDPRSVILRGRTTG